MRAAQRLQNGGPQARLTRLRPGMSIGWAPRLEDAARLVAAWARRGDTVLTLGAGDVDRAGPLILEALA